MKFNDPGVAPGVVPDLDPRDEEECYDPGIEGTYAEALSENRVALAHCRKKHSSVVESYNQVRERIPKKQ